MMATRRRSAEMEIAMRIVFDKELILAGHFLLKHLSRDHLRELAATTFLDNFPRGGVIFQKGDPGDSMMAVVRGKVKICAHSIDGKELVLNIIKQGGLLGEIALLDGEPRSADAVALEETDVLVLERAKFLPFLEQHFDVTTKLIALLCERLRQTSERLEDTMFLEAPSRLARTLLRLGGTFGKSSGQGSEMRLDIKLSQQQLGNLIGISRESVNKFINEWERDGLIAMESGIITLRDRDALEEIAISVA
jgi:CRP/FNR family cyclic AMP-dependent transcriptional regulator